MKESSFIDQNKEKWVEFETMFKNNDKDPEKLSELFIEVTNDLSYARSNYPHRSIKVYLNNLANGVFTKLYKNRFGGKRNILKFWKESLPKVMYESRKSLYFAFIIFASAFLIGIFSSMNDDSFARHMLGSSYINMTEEFIAEGDPMKVYKQMEQFEMFSYIALNNLIVSFRVFILGAMFAIGTVGALISEGIRIGAFQHFFIERGLFQESFLTIWMHGAPEISSIILAGAAGMTLGSGIIFPETYARGEAFLKGARRGIMIMLGIIPILVFAALIEGFVTRYTELNDVIRAVIIASNFAIIIYYFGIYPYRKYHNNKEYKAFEDKIPESPKKEIDFDIVRSSGEIYTDVFRIFGRHLSKLLKWSSLIAIPYVLSVMFLPDEGINQILSNMAHYGNAFTGSISVATHKVYELFNYTEHPMLYAINSLFFTFIATMTLYHFMKYVRRPKRLEGENMNLGDFMIKNAYRVAIFSYAYNLIFFVPVWLALCSLVFVLPCILLFIFISVYENRNPIFALTRGFRMIGSGYGLMIGYSMMILLIDFVMILLLNSGIVKYLFEMILSGFDIGEEIYSNIILGSSAFVTCLCLGTLLGSYLYAAGLFYFTSDEKLNATSLRIRVQKIGKTRKAYGLPTED
ncbi:MAG: putative membrane protein SpoIIM required for sporulation [Patiriisocius sp.]|jgi:uncharacterized membrane protein SpoIIM required for sporulation